MSALTGDRLRACSLAFGDNPDRLCAWCGQALPARRRRWCSDTCGMAWAVNHVWTTAREAALDRDSYTCRKCHRAVGVVLEVHHVLEVAGHGGYNAGCQHHQANLETLCDECHKREHRFRRRVERVLAASGATLELEQLPLPGFRAR